MNLRQVCRELTAAGVQLWVEDGRLRYRGPQTAIPPDTLQILRDHKTELLALLTSEPALGQPADEPREFPLSHGQQALWFLYLADPSSPAYNVAFSVRVRSPLDLDVLRRTFQKLVDRHPAMRTTVHMTGQQPMQVVHPRRDVAFAALDVAGLSDEELYEQVVADYRRPFDLQHGPAFRVSLFTRGARDHVLLVVMHHIVCDGWSLWILQDEFRTLYAAEMAGVGTTLPPLPANYGDFVRWQHEMLAGPAAAAQENWWRQQLGGELPLLQLATDRPRPAMRSSRGASHPFEIPAGVVARLRQLAQAEGVTLHTVMLAAFQTLLHRYTRQDDIILGTPTAGRDQDQFAGVVGYFINPVALRTDLSGDPTFRELLQRSRASVLGAISHQDFPFPLLVERLSPPRESGQSPIFQAVLALHRPQMATDVAALLPGAQKGARVDLPGLVFEPYDMPQQEGQFDLVMELLEAKDQHVLAVLKYSTDLFEPATAARMARHFRRLLESVVAEPGRRLWELEMLDTAERQLLERFNRTTTEYPRSATIQRLFEEQVGRTPDAIALECGERRWTYAELNAAANRWAHALRQRGVGHETLVSICLERSAEMIIGQLAILKAGGAYVPLDVDYPTAALAFMLEDTQAPVLVTRKTLAARFAGYAGRVLLVDADAAELAAEPVDDLPAADLPAGAAAGGDALAYIMYTSGSTGRPKGVEVTHRGVVRLVRNTNYFRVAADDVFLQFAPHSFDAATFEIWMPLLNGARLVVYPPKLPSIDELGRFLREHGITVLWATTGLFQQLVEFGLPWLAGLRRVMTGGDVASPAHMTRFLEDVPGCQLDNYYGPTENTTFTTWFELDPRRPAPAPVPIGRPIANTTCYVLGPKQELVPIGVPGELFIGGDGVARGYHRRDDLNQQRFILNPFDPQGRSRLYRTGDLVRWRADGNLEFLGRIDRQVKIRGFRIELDEVELALAQHPDVRDRVVVARPDSAGMKQLVAYVVPRPGVLVSVDELRKSLQQRLPPFMVPSAFVMLDALPLSPNGKLDRSALPAPSGQRPATDKPYVAPTTPTEKLLANIWAEVLGVDKVGRDDNFFELGGASIKSLRIVAKAEEAGLKIDPALLSPTVLFEHPTLAELAALWSPPATEAETPAIAAAAAPPAKPKPRGVKGLFSGV